MVQITEILNVLPRQKWLVGGERLENSLSGHNMKSGQDGVALVTSRAGGKEERPSRREKSRDSQLEREGRHECPYTLR